MSSLRVASSGAAPLKAQQSIEFEQRMKPTELIQGEQPNLQAPPHVSCLPLVQRFASLPQ